MITNQQIKRIESIVKDYILNNYSNYGLNELTSDEIEHVISIGANILANKWGIDTNPGSFVKAFLNNDLLETFSRADQINLKMIHFYLVLSYNVGKPANL